MAKEYFWGAKLSEDQKSVTWDPDADMHDDEDEDDDDAIEHFLFLKQAVLGVEAKEGKRNIIEIETTNFDGETVCQPLVSLKLGLNESVCLDIGLQPPVTFKLAAGSGPVFLSGQHALDLQENEDFREFRDEDEEDEDLEDLDADESIVDVTPDLRKVIKGKAAAKIAKAAKKPAEDEDEDDEDEEEEEEEEEVKVAKGKKRPAPSAGGSAKKMALGAGESDDEEESDEDEEDMEGEEDDEEEDDDEEDEKEEEEEESSPDKSPKKTKGKVNGVKKAEPAKVQGKTKGQKEKKKAFSTDEIKKSIMQSPSKPKKEEKFKNFVKARFHVTEPKKIQELWGWFKSTQLK